MYMGYETGDSVSFNEQSTMNWYNECPQLESNRDMGYDLTYGRGIPLEHPFYDPLMGGTIYGFALDGDARPLKGIWNSAGSYRHDNSECSGGVCNYIDGEATNALFEPNLDLLISSVIKLKDLPINCAGKRAKILARIIKNNPKEILAEYLTKYLFK